MRRQLKLLSARAPLAILYGKSQVFQTRSELNIHRIFAKNKYCRRSSTHSGPSWTYKFATFQPSCFTWLLRLRQGAARAQVAERRVAMQFFKRLCSSWFGNMKPKGGESGDGCVTKAARKPKQPQNQRQCIRKNNCHQSWLREYKRNEHHLQQNTEANIKSGGLRRTRNRARAGRILSTHIRKERLQKHALERW